MINKQQIFSLNLIEEIAEAKKVSIQSVLLSLQNAIKKAYEKEDIDANIEVTIDEKSGNITICKILSIIDDKNISSEKNENGVDEKIYNENNQILFSDAIKIDSNAKVGGIIKKNIDINSLNRRTVLHILQVLKHNVTIESNKSIYNEWINKKGTIIYAEVENVDEKHKLVTVNLDKTFGVLSRTDQNPNETLIPGVKYKFFIKDVIQQSKGWPIILSRSDGAIIKELLQVNIPEIQTGTVQIIKVGRVAGFKSKVVVKSLQEGIDPVGACIGAKADRIRPILTEMGQEKIEFVAFDEDTMKYFVNICNPVHIHGYKIIDAVYEKNENNIQKEIQRKKIIFIVNENYLPLMIGRQGKNVRVLSNLLDADVEVITIDDAKIAKIDYITVNNTILPSINNTKNNTQNKPVNKFEKIYDKYRKSTYDILSDINKNNEIVDTMSKNKNDSNKNQQSNEEMESYKDDLEAIDELTKM